MIEQAMPTTYPVRLEVERPIVQSRWKALFRIFLALPVLIFAAIVGGTNFGGRGAGEQDFTFAAGAAGAVIIAIWITILLRRNIPRWLFDFLVAAQRFEYRAFGYLCLLTDEYPPFEGDHAIRYEVDYPERVSRWRVIIWKAITSLVHVIVLAVLFLTLIIVVPIAWLAILFTGRYPEGLHTYVSGVIRWGARVQAYAISLTDEFPPFSLAPDAGPGGQSSYTISAVIGVVAVIAAIGGGVGLAVIAIGGKETKTLSYDDLLAGNVTVEQAKVVEDPVVVTLSSAIDPADDAVGFLTAKEDYRLVSYRYVIDVGEDEGDLRIKDDDFRLKDSEGDDRKPLLAVIGGRVNSAKVKDGTSANVDLVFEVPTDRQVSELRYRPRHFFADTVVYEFD